MAKGRRRKGEDSSERSRLNAELEWVKYAKKMGHYWGNF